MIAAHVPLITSTDRSGTTSFADARRRAVMLAGTANAWLAQTLCGIRGHAMMLHFESTRLSLECACCGRRTPGWSIESSRS
jgi:hypothetical protein